ncbi:MAG: FAD-binding oxidoreductase [Chloroflexota bacterium]
MSNKQTANVVIVGGGVIGASIAFHLAESGCKDVLLLDKGPLGSGTTPNAAGQTAHLTYKESARQFVDYCSTFLQNFADKTGYAINFQASGSLRIAMTPTYTPQLQGYVETADALQDDSVYLIDEQTARELVPSLHFPESPASILWNGGDGYIDEPKSVALAYAAAARDRGVVIQTNTRVTKLCIEHDRICGVQTNRGMIEAKHVVVAAGAWTRQLMQSRDISVASVPVRHQAYVTVPMNTVDRAWPIVRVIEPQLYVRPHKGGMLVGGYGYRPLSFDMDDFPADFEIASLEADAIYYSRLQETAIHYFPMLADVPIAQERRGLPTVTPDAEMMVDEVEAIAGLVVATGCQVAGVAYSAGIGRVAADVVLGQPCFLTEGLDSENGEVFAVDRFGDLYMHDDAKLRDHCEKAYGTMYWGK